MFQDKALKTIYSIHWLNGICYVITQDPFGNFINVASASIKKKDES